MMIKKLLPLLLLILIGCSEPEPDPINIKLLEWRKSEGTYLGGKGTFYYLNSPYSGLVFDRERNEKGQLTNSYFLYNMTNGVPHGSLKKFEDGNDIPIYKNTNTNGNLVGPLILYDLNGTEHQIDDTLFDVLFYISTYGDTTYYEEPNGFRFLFDSKNEIIKTYSKVGKSDTESLESLKNIDTFGRKYNKWYRWYYNRVEGVSDVLFTGIEPYFYSDYIRELIGPHHSTTYSFRLVEPYKIELTIKNDYLYDENDSTEKFILVPVEDSSFDLSISEVNIPKNVEYFEEIKKKSRNEIIGTILEPLKEKTDEIKRNLEKNSFED